ncbi:MAG: hypothetical protein HC899_05985, partial [Leptolyngbyaceae cyanobacterium SM1_4_3]|nr:hypothetical protein [Leptolyngbyaceae cyanobacterium SM1_4_3]
SNHRSRRRNWSSDRSCFKLEGWYVIGIDQKPNPGLAGIDCYIHADAADPQKLWRRSPTSLKPLADLTH